MLTYDTPVFADFLNVGFGQSIVLRAEDASFPVIVIDGGDDRAAFYAHPKRLSLAGYLRQHAISTIDCMIATHPHRDHVGGLLPALDVCRVKRLITPYDVAVPGEWPRAHREDNIAMGLTRQHLLLQAARRQGCEISITHAAHTLEMGPIRIRVYPLPLETMRGLYAQIRACCEAQQAPDIAGRLRALDLALNAGSLCLQANLHEHTLLLTSDQPLSYWDAMPAEQIRADVLTGLHHGDCSRLSPAFLRKVSASAAVISADTQGMYGLPSATIAEKLQQGGVSHTLFASGSQHADTASGARLVFRPGRPVEQLQL